MIDSGSEYHFFSPSVIDGATMSPNNSFATIQSSCPVRNGDYSYRKNRMSTNGSQLDTARVVLLQRLFDGSGVGPRPPMTQSTLVRKTRILWPGLLNVNTQNTRKTHQKSAKDPTFVTVSTRMSV